MTEVRLRTHWILRQLRMGNCLGILTYKLRKKVDTPRGDNKGHNFHDLTTKGCKSQVTPGKDVHSLKQRAKPETARGSPSLEVGGKKCNSEKLSRRREIRPLESKAKRDDK